MSFAKRMHTALDDIDAELSVLSDEGVIEELSAREIEDLIFVEEGLAAAHDQLRRILTVKGEEPVDQGQKIVVPGTISSEEHFVFQLLSARKKRRHERAVRLRRSFLKVVE